MKDSDVEMAPLIVGNGDGSTKAPLSFDPTDPSIDKSMQEMLKEINDLFSFEYEFNVRAISSNKPISYVRRSSPQFEKRQ
jgi:hypothetical protein